MMWAISPTVSSILSASVVAFLGLVGTVGATYVNKRRTKNDDASFADEMVDTARDMMLELREALEKEKERNDLCERRYSALVEYLKSMGLHPPEID